MDIAVRAGASKIFLIGVSLIFIRWLPVSLYNKYLSWQINRLDSDIVKYHYSNLIECIKFTKRHSVKYKNTHDEAVVLMKQFYNLQRYKMKVVAVITSYRRKYGLHL